MVDTVIFKTGDHFRTAILCNKGGRVESLNVIVRKKPSNHDEKSIKKDLVFCFNFSYSLFLYLFLKIKV